MPIIQSRLRVRVKTIEIDEQMQLSFMPWRTTRERGTLPGPDIVVPDDKLYMVGPRGRHLDDAGLRCLVREAERRGWTGLCLDGCESLTGAGFRELGRLGGLRALSLWNCRLDDTAMQIVGELRELECLSTGLNQIDDVVLVHLRHLRKLRHLCVRNTRMTGTGLVHLLPLVELESLSLGGVHSPKDRPPFAETSLLLLDELPRLRQLDVHLPLSDVALAALAKLEGLEALTLDAREMTGPALRHLGGLKNLRCLSVGGMREIGGHLRRLRPLPLRTLDLSDSELSPTSLEALAGLPIEALCLYGAKFDEEAFRPVAALPELRRIRLIKHPLTDQSMPYLAACQNLEDLTLTEMDITDGGMWYLSALRKMRRLTLNRLNITEDSLLRLPGMFGLEELDLGLNDLYEGNLAVLENFPRLTTFTLGWGYSWKNAEQYEEPASARLTDRGLRHLAPLHRLRRLTLRGTYATDDGLFYLRDLTELEYLHVQGLFTGSGLRHLSGMKHLSFLHLDAPLCDEHLVHLRRLPRLGYLLLGETLITDQGVRHLRRLRSVHSLNLDATLLTPSGLAELRRLPTLESLNQSDLKRNIAPWQPRPQDVAAGRAAVPG